MRAAQSAAKGGMIDDGVERRRALKWKVEEGEEVDGMEWALFGVGLALNEGDLSKVPVFGCLGLVNFAC